MALKPSPSVTIHHGLAFAARRLAALSETPSLEAQVLLAHMLGQPRAWLLAHPETILTEAQAGALSAGLARLEGGEPLPYVLGRWEFFGLSFQLTPDVLIPRPETELLVETALAEKSWQSPGGRVLDVGAGSGCIAVTLAVNAPGVRVLAVDISLPALVVTARNARQHGVAGRLQGLCADLLSPLACLARLAAPIQTFDLITANLPYIPTALLASLPIFRSQAHPLKEPPLALDGGGDGLVLIRRLLADAPRCLAPGGLLLLEIEASQGEAVAALAQAAFPAAEVQTIKDLSGHDRMIKVKALE